MSDQLVSISVAELSDKIDKIRFAMFTTVDVHGHLISRPMTNQEMDAEGNLWFYTSTETDLWENIVARPEVNLAFAEPDEHLYISVSGRAERVVERAKIKSLWNPAVQAWYPHGPDDPHVVLVRVVTRSAEFWDAKGGRIVQMYEMAKAVLTGSAPAVDAGEHGKVSL